MAEEEKQFFCAVMWHPLLNEIKSKFFLKKLWNSVYDLRSFFSATWAAVRKALKIQAWIPFQAIFPAALMLFWKKT